MSKFLEYVPQIIEFLSFKRSISKAQAKALAEFFSVDVGLFI